MITGKCRCGAVSYEIALEQLPPIYACHCHICQRATGSAFSVQALVREDILTVSGPVITREIVTEDRVSLQRFCAECHARVYNTNSARPAIAVVCGGTIDRSEELVCKAHIFTNYKQGWVAIPEDVPQRGEAAPQAEFVAALFAS